MKITEAQIDQILEQGENGNIDVTPYMGNLQFLIMEDDEIELTEEDQAYLIFLGAICMEALKRNDMYKDVDDEDLLYDMEDANWETLETVDGDLDRFMDKISEDFEEQELLDFVAYSILPVDDDDDDDEPVMSSEDAQILGFVRIKGLIDTILLPAV